MKALSLLLEARAKGVALAVIDGGRKIDVKWNSPPNPNLLARLRANKPDLLELLHVERIAGRPVIAVEIRDGKRVWVFERGGPDL